MILGKDKSLRQFKWQIIVIAIVVSAVVMLTLFTDIFQNIQAGPVPQIIQFFGTLIILAVVLTILSGILKMLKTLAKDDAKLEKILADIRENRELLSQIKQNTQLSETTRAITSRYADQQALREIVFDKLQQQDFDATYEIIDKIAKSTSYQELAEQLRTEAESFRNAGDAERVNQVIAHIEKLLDNYEWTKASTQIEKLIKAEPNSEKAKAMRQSLIDKKEQRKKILLTAWDDAVRRGATNRSLELLKELDLYLTSNEGLALQEAARDVFRSKLHSLGVSFSLAVSGKEWAKALETGMEITRDFPNSRMAEEIREKMSILKQKVEQKLQ